MSGISSRIRARCRGGAGDRADVGKAGRLRGPAAPSPATIAARRSHSGRPPASARSITSAAPGLEVRTSAKRPRGLARAASTSGVQRVAAEQRVAVNASGARPAGKSQGTESRRRAPGVRGGRDRDVTALAVGEDEQPAPRAWATWLQQRAARQPRRSKQASCGLTATHAGPAASMSARQCASTGRGGRSVPPTRVARGAPAAGGRDGRAGGRRRASARSPGVGEREPDVGARIAGGGGRRPEPRGVGIDPEDDLDSRAATAAARRSPKVLRGDQRDRPGRRRQPPPAPGRPGGTAT